MLQFIWCNYWCCKVNECVKEMIAIKKFIPLKILMQEKITQTSSAIFTVEGQ